MGVSVGDDAGVVVGVVFEELEEDDEEGLRVLVVEVGPIVSGILITAGVSQQSVFDCPQHQVVACSASLSQGVTGALPLAS
jgi:hypothetical protein